MITWGFTEAHVLACCDSGYERALLAKSLRIYRSRGERQKARDLLSDAYWFGGPSWKS